MRNTCVDDLPVGYEGLLGNGKPFSMFTLFIVFTRENEHEERGTTKP
jgi:hypothetical protein